MKKTFAILAVSSLFAGAHAFSLFDFESFAATTGGSLTSLVDTDAGLTMTLARNSGERFDILDTTPWRGTPFQFPLQFGRRVLDPFFNPTINDAFVANFSQQVTAVEVEMGDFGADSDNLVMEVWSGLNGTGTLIATVTSNWGTRTFPSYDALGWNNAGNSLVTAQSIVFVGGSTGFQNSMYIDNIAAEAVPEPATLAVLGLGAAALLRRRCK